MEQLASDYKNDIHKYYNGICLDLDIDQTESQYTEINKSIIAGGCRSENGIMANIALANIKNSDTAKADTYKDKYKRPEGSVQILTKTADGLNIFMDNFTAYGLTHKQHMAKVIKNDEVTEDLTKKSEDTGYYNSLLRLFLNNNIPFADRDNIKIKAIECREDKDKRLIQSQKDIYNQQRLGGLENVSDEYSTLKYKISTNELKLSQLYETLTPEKIHSGLNKLGLYIYDYDITTDVKGCIDKKQFIDYLMHKHNFTFAEGQKHKNIIENDKTVSNTCLSFWLENSTGFLRVKLYDKFKQSLESGSVRGNVGSHLNNWINNPGYKLRDTLKESIPYGILRIEISYTLEKSPIKTPPNLDQVKKDLDYVKQLLVEAPGNAYFYCSIDNQYKQLIEQVKENVIVYNVSSKTMLFCRWYNSLTGKINGFWKDKANKTDFILILKHFTFNRPFKLILMETYEEILETDELYIKGAKKGQQKPPIKTQKIKLNFKMYKKESLTSSVEHTILTDTGQWEDENENGKNKRTNKPEEMGIIPHENIIWQVAGKKRDKSIKENDINFIPIIHSDELNIIGKQTAIKQLKQEEENGKINKELLTLKTEATEQFNKFIKAQELKEGKVDIETKYRKALNIWDNLNKFTDYKEGQQFELHAFKKTSNSEGCTFTFYDAEQNIKIYGNAQLNGFLKKCVNNNPEYYQYLKGDIYYLFRNLNALPTATITIKNYEYCNGKRKANLIIKPNPLIYRKEEELNTYTYLNYRDEELLNQKAVRKTFINVKTLDTDKEFYIHSIHRVKDNYIFKMLDKDLKPIENQIYSGNYYINNNEDIKHIYNNNIQTIPFKIKIGKEKTTPTNNKAVYIYVIINKT